MLGVKPIQGVPAQSDWKEAYHTTLSSCYHLTTGVSISIDSKMVVSVFVFSTICTTIIHMVIMFIVHSMAAGTSCVFDARCSLIAVHVLL